MHAPEQLKLDSSTLSQEHFNRVVGSGSLFGWDQNTYDAGSDLITLRFLFSACDIPFKDLPLMQWMLSNAHSHELGHYVLVSSTRLGITLRKISALLDGLVPIVAEEMLSQKGKIWIPLEKYLEEESGDSHIAKLVKAISVLESLCQRLTESWRITNEIFALCSSVTLGAIKKSALLGKSEEEHIWILSVLLSDPTRVDRVVNKLSKALGRNSLFEDRMPGPSDWELVMHSAEVVFSGDEKKEALDVLRVMQMIDPGKAHGPAPGTSAESAFKDVYEAIAVAFAQGKPEHRAALAFFQRFVQDSGDIIKIMAIISILSGLYAPLLPPAELLRDKGCIARLPEIDRILEPALNRLMQTSLDDIMANTKQAADEINWIQQTLGSVTLQHLSHVQTGHILGSIEWFEKLFDELQLNRRQRAILRGLLAGSQLENDKYMRIISTQGRKVVPRVVQPLFSLFWAVRRWIVPHSPRFDKVYQSLKTLCLTNFRSLENIVSLYYPLLTIPKIISKYLFFLPPVNICYNSNGLIVALGSDQKSLNVRHAVLRSILAALRQMLVRPPLEAPIVLCPLGVMGDDSDFCREQQGHCIIKRLVSLFRNDSLLLCCKKDIAKLLRLEQGSASLQEVGQMGLSVRWCDFYFENDIEKKKGSDTDNKHVSSTYTPNENEEKLLEIMKKNPLAAILFTGIKGAISGLTAVVIAPVMLIMYLYTKNIERQQRRIDRHTNQCLSDMWVLLERLEFSARTKD
jgi:hypothetical protein